ncbi:NAD(P)-binding domain-containing protein [Paenibacillus aceris]|uniref:Thioredoxin reductase n=1 Tax=Paenibacillus aceris TaxID=869555 RepID=A0ABS4HWR2_9BACL|nr:NAD(P)-binding domain-containing protein [Paenibacillus aceris]MBP1962993.1 thioredoxin reductase [Paenibacillus aceris]NHW38418.1 NAD(P)/FAD-dependent oxidoreductase [Paenibacillus aceris]
MSENNLPTQTKLPVAIIGAGPVGLAAAAHLATRKEAFVLLEAGNEVSSNIASWSHVRLFSPWEFNIDKAARQLLSSHGWKAPNNSDIPTGLEMIENYFKPLANLPEIKPYLHFNAKVVAASRKGLSKVKTQSRDELPFVLHVEKNGERMVVEARAVIDATGTWTNPNPVLSEGVWTTEENSLSNHIFYGIPDVLGKHKERYVGKKVLVVGSGHSAINTLLELGELKDQVQETEIVWVLRKSMVKDVYGGQEQDQLAARGELGTRIQKLVESGKVKVLTSFYIQELKTNGEKIQVIGSYENELLYMDDIDEIVSNTGSRPDLSFLREVRVITDPSLESTVELAPLIDPNVHSCGTVRPHGEKELRQPEKDFYIVGSKSYGRAPTFLMTTGYEQVRSVVAALVGDYEAAERVELELPETGVCSIQTNSCCDSEQSNQSLVKSEAVSSCCSTVTKPVVSKSSCCS